jgi:hypothetical protein
MPKQDKERVERYVLGIAREVGIPIPNGETKDEEPDFRFENWDPPLGIELSEILRPAESNHGLLPVAEEKRHRAIVATAQKIYRSDPSAIPVKVNVYWEGARGQLLNWDETTAALVAFVRNNAHLADPIKTFEQPGIPKGLFSITMMADRPSEWRSGECSGYELGHVKPQVELSIAKKDKRVAAYRLKMSAAAHLWLLLYSDIAICRGMMIPAGADEWQIASQFDRVFWVDLLERSWIELKGARASALS